MNRKAFFVAVILFALVALLPSASGVVAQGPAPAGGTISYAGRLSNDAGQPVADGVYALTFALYDAAKDGNLLWSETQTGVTVKGGAFTALLGSVKPLPKEARISKGWLVVSVRGPGETGFTELAPRQALNAAAPASPSSPATAPSCPHTHFGELWSGDSGGTLGHAGLALQDTHSNGTGLWGEADTGTNAWGVFGTSTSGKGVYGFSSSGTAVYAAGTGVIKSEADSTLWLSPHSMINRGSANLTLTPQQDGEVTVASTGGTGDRYLSIPVSTFGTLFGAPVYVKSVTVCYAAGTTGKIVATAVTKNDGGTGAINYIYDTTVRNATAPHTCYTLAAGTPLKAIDNSTWVQLNMNFTDATANAKVTIYTVALTLTELP